MLKRLMTAVFVLSWTALLPATTLEVGGSLTNLFWSPQRAANAAGYSLSGSDLFWQLDGAVTQELSDGLLFKGGLVQDPVLMRRLYAQLSFEMDSLSIRFAPFIGTLNTTQKWFNPGLEAAVQYTFPGFGFLMGGFSTSFAPLSKEGDYYLSSEYVTLGFVVENGIVSLSIEDKSSVVRQAALADIQNYSTRYLLDNEIFVKNFPLRTAILLGYQAVGRQYVSAVVHDTPLYSVLAGLRLTFEVSATSSLYCEGLGSVFNLGGLDTVLTVPESSLLYQLHAGFKFQL